MAPGKYHDALVRMESVCPSLPQETSMQLGMLLEKLYSVDAERRNDRHKIVLSGQLKADFLKATEIYDSYVKQQELKTLRKTTPILE